MRAITKILEKADDGRFLLGIHLQEALQNIGREPVIFRFVGKMEDHRTRQVRFQGVRVPKLQGSPHVGGHREEPGLRCRVESAALHSSIDLTGTSRQDRILGAAHGSRTLRFYQLDLYIVPVRSRQLPICRHERRFEHLGEGNIYGIVGAQRGPHVPYPLKKLGMGIAYEWKISEIRQRLTPTRFRQLPASMNRRNTCATSISMRCGTWSVSSGSRMRAATFLPFSL